MGGVITSPHGKMVEPGERNIILHEGDLLLIRSVVRDILYQKPVSRTNQASIRQL